MNNAIASSKTEYSRRAHPFRIQLLTAALTFACLVAAGIPCNALASEMGAQTDSAPALEASTQTGGSSVTAGTTEQAGSGDAYVKSTGAEPPKTVTRKHEYLRSEGQPAIAPSIKDDEGNTYRLIASATDRVQDYIAPTRDYSDEVDITIAPEQVDEAQNLVPTTVAVDEDGFEGSIPLQDIESDPIYESCSRQVDRTVVYDSLPSNDVTLIPTESTFTVSSDSAVDATDEAVLQRAGVTYTVQETDQSGVPTLFSATVTFRGEERYLALTGYSVRAYYGGTVSSDDEMLCTTATYTLVTKAISPTSGAVTTAALQTPEQTTVEKAPQGTTWAFAPGESLIGTIVLIGICTLLAGIGIVIVAYRRKKGLQTHAGIADKVKRPHAQS